MYGRRRITGVDVFAGLIIGLSAILIIGVIASAIITESDCRSKGGKMVGTGEHTTHLIYAGEGVYTTMETENKACDKE
ncbi:hypothetical protein [Bacillus phage vB_BanS-Thrax1]|nr:hypothetical protein [Bacillus phage vB_BanS-Thrax1]